MSDTLVEVEYDQDTGFYWAEIDPSETRPVLALGSLLETIDDSEPIDVPRLYDAFNCEALDRLVVDHHRDVQSNGLDLELTTHRLQVCLSCGEQSTVVKIRPQSE